MVPTSTSGPLSSTDLGLAPDRLAVEVGRRSGGQAARAALAAILLTLEAGLVGTCGIIELEVRYSALSHPKYEEITRDRRLGYESFPIPDEVWDGALEVQRALSERG
ncbi:hypothetical protein BH24ACT2_BH24ACT2_08620 [soil metagenome]